MGSHRERVARIGIENVDATDIRTTLNVGIGTCGEVSARAKRAGLTNWSDVDDWLRDERSFVPQQSASP